MSAERVMCYVADAMVILFVAITIYLIAMVKP
jgi:hypothetical protein